MLMLTRRHHHPHQHPVTYITASQSILTPLPYLHLPNHLLLLPHRRAKQQVLHSHNTKNRSRRPPLPPSLEIMSRALQRAGGDGQSAGQDIQCPAISFTGDHQNASSTGDKISPENLRSVGQESLGCWCETDKIFWCGLCSLFRSLS